LACYNLVSSGRGPPINNNGKVTSNQRKKLISLRGTISTIASHSLQFK